MIPILRAFGASDTILPLASEYISILLFGFLFGFFMMMNPMMRIEGFPKRAMATMLIFTAVNLICTPTFIFVFGLGIRGAALGTCTANVTISIWMLLFLTGKKRVIRLTWRYCRPKPRYLWQVIQLGLPTFLMNFTQSILSVVMNTRLVLYGGDIAVSAWGVTNNISNLVNQPVLGMNQGVQPIVGYNIGAKKYDRVKQTLTYSLLVATAISCFGWLITRVFPSQIISLFNNDPELIAVGSHMLIVFRAMIFVTGFQQAGAAYFQFAGKPLTSVLLTLSRQVFFLLPCIIILSGYFQMDGILYSGPISDTIATVIVVFFIIKEIRRLNQLAKEQAHEQALQA
jgi:putative MATE family efflux protein